MQDIDLISRTKRVSQLLLLSVALNISLLTTLAYLAVREKEIVIPTVVSAEENRLQQQSNRMLLETFATYNMQQLFLLLGDQEPVEEGYAKRDLALSCLVAFHHFDVEKALGTPPPQKRESTLSNPTGGEQTTFTLFPGLTEYHYQAIVRFAKTERWPLTPKGLFLSLQKSGAAFDPSLGSSFVLTPQYQTLSMLFMKSGMVLSQRALLQLLIEGEWEFIEAVSAQLGLVPDFSPARRQALLVEFLKKRSVIAARILIEADRSFAVKRLADEEILLLLDLYPVKSPFLISFAKDLLSSPRSDRVWEAAAQKAELQMAHEKRVSEESSPLPVVQKQSVVPAKSTRSYTVQKGDSLWKIAKRFHTRIDLLKKINQLSSDTLRPGEILQIPAVGTTSQRQ